MRERLASLAGPFGFLRAGSRMCLSPHVPMVACGFSSGYGEMLEARGWIGNWCVQWLGKRESIGRGRPRYFVRRTGLHAAGRAPSERL